MGKVAAIGWTLFVVSCVFAALDRRYHTTLVEQKDNCIALWRGENQRIRNKLAASEDLISKIEGIQQTSDQQAAKVRAELADVKAKLAKFDRERGKRGRFSGNKS